MNNENTSIIKLTGQGDNLLSRYSSPSAGKRERIMKHTQGKWTSTYINKKHTFGYNTYMITDDEGTVAITKRFHVNLIASAPEMLEMLKYTLKYFQENTDMEGLEMYENLIAKAEGNI
jgi:hypothetical protein